jgi:type IV pilus assembly protein PilQ
VAKLVKKLLSARGTVDVDERTNTVILKDIASVIDEATALIKAIDTQTPQVMVESKIVEANLDFLREIGSTWGAGVQPLTDAWDPDSDLDQTIGGDAFRLRPNKSSSNSFAVSNPITELATGAINLGAFILDERFDVDLTLAGAESHGEGKVISSPRVVTLDNRKARIEQGVSIPFQTFEDGDAKLEFIDAVLSLDVTPHITADRSIIMKIAVTRNAPDDSVPTPTGSPAIAKNQATTETLVKDGQTLVIGGIYVVQTADRESRVPYFHRVPVIGSAFKNKEVRDIRKELLVFVTPRIVVNPELGS